MYELEWDSVVVPTWPGKWRQKYTFSLVHTLKSKLPVLKPMKIFKVFAPSDINDSDMLIETGFSRDSGCDDPRVDIVHARNKTDIFMTILLKEGRRAGITCCVIV